MPSVIGKTFEEAKSKLEHAGLSQARKEPPEGTGSGQIEKHEPSAGIEVSADTAVILTMRKPKPPEQRIGFKHSDAHVAGFCVNRKEDGQPKSWESGKKTAGYPKAIHFQGTAWDIHITARASTRSAWDPVG